VKTEIDHEPTNTWDVFADEASAVEEAEALLSLGGCSSAYITIADGCSEERVVWALYAEP